MSLTPANLFNVGSTTIPTLFLEARVHGGPADEIISQLGLSLNSNQVDVALFTRTSGIVLIAGVGSYCAYRVCAKYLGKEFVWTLIDATRLDRLSRADSRLLHPAAEGYLTSRQSSTFYEERARKRLCQLLRSLSEDDKAISAGGLSVLGSSGRQSPAISHASSAKQQKQRYRLLSTRSGSPVRVVCTTNQLLRRSFQKPENEQKESASGLGNIRNWVLDETDTENRTLNTRKHIPLLGEDDRCDAMSDITSVSRAQPPPNALLRTNCCVDVDGDLIEDEDAHEDSWSRSSYRRSLCAESLCWNDEFQRDNAPISNPLFSCDSSSNISELSAMKNLEEMWKTDRRGTVDSSATSLILRLANDLDDTSSCCGTHNLDLAALIESKCSVKSASYMYQSVHIDNPEETNEPLVDGDDTQSVLSAGFTAQLLKDSHGLLEISASRPQTLEKNSTNETVKLQPPGSDEPSTSRLMTESYKSSSSSKSQKRSTMFDSAIDTDFLSDDDKPSLHGHTSKCSGNQDTPKSEQKTPLARSTAKKSSWLDRISENSPQHRARQGSVVSSIAPSIAPSEKSLEWFDEMSTTRQKSIEPCAETEEGTAL